jgi:hypothetical protein
MEDRKKVFISYSWDSESHQKWVLKLATDLMKLYGIDVILDQFELAAGNDLTYFMESAISEADKVLVILTPSYKVKAEKREKGVGYETSIISQEILSSPISQIKFIPILREGNQKSSSPMHLVSKLYHNMVNNENYYLKLLELAKLVYDINLVQKPQLGKVPNFDNAELNDSLLDVINNFTKETALNNNLDKIIDSRKGAEKLIIERDLIGDLIQKKGEFYTENTEIGIKTKNSKYSISINCMGYSAVVDFNNIAINTAKYSSIIVTYYKGYLNFNDYSHSSRGELKQLSKVEYLFDLDINENIVWKSKDIKITSEKLVDEIFYRIIFNLKSSFEKKFRK